ncbi:MucR family transcriptional regulator [Pseudoruegeria sp. HB172150]|uniref:MucR family transcriptional regulator n=1 Tax=Pseudoruegeria sp. HB172150 TaxID=2721164 RepID=UPI0015562DD7|nr:MucR family transcriptional regulator [Pseudoruegeria sp. HB172150]
MTDARLEADTEHDDTLSLTAEIVAAYVGRNQMAAGDLPALNRSIHKTLSGLTGNVAAEVESARPAAALVPAVPIDASVGKDAIACLECGKDFKTLKRHLSTEHQLTPTEYRERWQLSNDYPVLAPSYSARRSKTAKKIGLGRKAKAA